MVPKYVAVTPNDKYVVVTNWCSWTVSIVNEATHHLVATIPVGAYPRGIAISPDSHLAYVAIMGSDVIDVISLSTFKSSDRSAASTTCATSSSIPRTRTFSTPR